jgi:ribosomal protein S12 methylthiotransferase
VHLARNAQRVGTEVEVLVERVDAVRGTLSGRTPADAPEVDGSIRVSGVRQARPGAFVRARITAVDGYDLLGEPVAPRVG